jgi:hypothetical protein
MKLAMTGSFNALIAHVTGGRRYCFVMMSYHEGYTFFEKLRKIVAEVTGFECIRADDLPGAGDDLRTKIHDAIDNAVFIIGDVSEPRPNIYYEVGYAAARNKPVLLIAKEGSDIHTDLHGLEMIRYIDNKEGWQLFEVSLRQHLDIHKDSNVSLLRAMVLPPDPIPSFIILNPKQTKAKSRFQHHPKERKTYGDYLGLSGIMGTFVSVYGEHVIPEIVNASNTDEGILEWDANLFLIGSPKVNKYTGRFLKMMQTGKSPNWRFERCRGEENIKDYEMKLCGEPPSGIIQTDCIGMNNVDTSANSVDYGLIIRGIHPHMPNRIVLILAGPHSVGTGAACLAATKPQLLQTISHKLIGKAELTDRKNTIWILVKGVTDDSGHLNVSGVSILDAGVI